MEYSHSYLSRMSERAGGAFYLFDKHLYIRNYVNFKALLSHCYYNSEVAYSFKANYMPAIGRILDDIGGMAEVVSRLEYDIALLHLPPERVIFNGPVKRKQDLAYAITQGSVVNIDSFCEIGFIEELTADFSSIRVGLRVNFKLGDIESRFGFSIEDGSFSQAVARLCALPNVLLVSLHSHFSTKQKSIGDFQARVRGMRRALDQLPVHNDVADINLGGGFFGHMPATLRAQFPYRIPSMEEYASALGETFSRCFAGTGVRLIIEPGISLVGDTMDLIAPVVEIRRRHGRDYALLDTSVNVVNPTRSNVKRTCYAVNRYPVNSTSATEFLLVGNTCMEHDVIDDGFSATLSQGDFVVFPNRGAYSNNYTPPFIAPPPAIMDRHGDILKHADASATVLASYKV